MERLTDEIYIFFSKIYTVLAWILLGLIGKFSMDYVNGKRLTFRQGLASSGIAIFVGIMADVLCTHFGIPEQSKFITPISTLLSDNIMKAIFTLKWKMVVHQWFDWWSNFTKNKE